MAMLFPAGAPAGPAILRFENRSSRPRVAIIESRHWIADCLTADRVTALQAFRDLFSEDVLRPGDEVAIGRVTLLFSDLRASTALYERIGDAAAYHLVREHFAFMTDQAQAAAEQDENAPRQPLHVFPGKEKFALPEVGRQGEHQQSPRHGDQRIIKNFPFPAASVEDQRKKIVDEVPEYPAISSEAEYHQHHPLRL